MVDQSFAHEALAWARQRLDDLDTIVTEVEKSISKLEEGAREETDRALARLRDSRAKLQQYVDSLHTEADAAKRDAADIQDALKAEWVEVESAFQSILSAAREQTETVRGLMTARAEAQRRSWEASVKDLRLRAEEAVDKARGELDAAIVRLSDEAEKFQSRIGEVKDAGDESWEAVKSRLAEAKAVHDRTIQKIRDAVSKWL